MSDQRTCDVCGRENGTLSPWFVSNPGGGSALEVMMCNECWESVNAGNIVTSTRMTDAAARIAVARAGGALPNPEAAMEANPAPRDPWRHRSAGLSCATCMWYVPKERSGPSHPDDPEVGRCRRHAPTMNGYPVVFRTDWCGEHKLDENRVTR